MAISSVWRRICLALGRGQADATPEKPEAEPMAKPADHLTRLTDGMQKQREDLAAFGTGVGTAAGIATVGTTLATFDKFFPVPAYWQAAAWVPLGLLLLAALASALLTRRYFSARRRILIDTDSSASATWRKGLDDDETRLLIRPLTDFAIGEGCASTDQVDLRIKRLGRIASRFRYQEKATVADTASAEQDRLTKGLQLAMVEGAAALLEYRSVAVFKGKLTVLYGFLVAFGVGGMFFAADWSQGERERITAWNDCQAAKTVDNLKPIVCSELDPRRFLRDASKASPTPEPPGPSVTTTPDPGPVQRLFECAKVTGSTSPQPSVPSDLRNRALAQCAGLPQPGPAEASPTALPAAADMTEDSTPVR